MPGILINGDDQALITQSLQSTDDGGHHANVVPVGGDENDIDLWDCRVASRTRCAMLSKNALPHHSAETDKLNLAARRGQDAPRACHRDKRCVPRQLTPAIDCPAHEGANNREQRLGGHHAIDLFPLQQDPHECKDPEGLLEQATMMNKQLCHRNAQKAVPRWLRPARDAPQCPLIDSAERRRIQCSLGIQDRLPSRAKLRSHLLVTGGEYRTIAHRSQQPPRGAIISAGFEND